MLIKMKKITLSFLVATTIVTTGFMVNTQTVSALENEDQIEELSKTYMIPKEELEELAENLEETMESVPELEIGEDYEAPISDNIILKFL